MEGDTEMHMSSTVEASSSRNRRLNRPRRVVRPIVLNLDGATSSSEDETETPVKKCPRMLPNKHITTSPDKMSRGVMSDLSDSESESRVVYTTPPKLSRIKKNSGSDSSDDIFAIHLSKHAPTTIKDAYKEFTTVKPLESKNGLSNCSTLGDVDDADSDIELITDDFVVKSPKRENEAVVGDAPPSPPLFEIDRIDQTSNRTLRRRPRGRPRKSSRNRGKRKPKESTISTSPLITMPNRKSTRHILHNEVESPLHINESLNLSSDVILSEDEDINPEMRVFIQWGSETLQLPIRKYQKFSYLYEELAKKYKVSSERVLLNFKDKIINPMQCPDDIGLSLVDIIEGGLGSNNYQVQPTYQQASKPISVDPNSISLNVQSSNRKDLVVIRIGLTDKMGLLMHKYAEEKEMSLKTLKFMFDGDVLLPNSTPASLDLEGGECIDVYDVS